MDDTADRAAGSARELARRIGTEHHDVLVVLGTGLAGTAALGQIFDRLGWPACVGGIGLALLAAALLASGLREPTKSGDSRSASSR